MFISHPVSIGFPFSSILCLAPVLTHGELGAGLCLLECELQSVSSEPQDCSGFHKQSGPDPRELCFHD